MSTKLTGLAVLGLLFAFVPACASETDDSDDSDAKPVVAQPKRDLKPAATGHDAPTPIVPNIR